MKELKRIETFLSFGLQFGVNQKKSDYISLAGQIQNPNDPKLNSSNLSETGFEFGSGIYLITPRLNVGISMPNMLYKNIESAIKVAEESINSGAAAGKLDSLISLTNLD